MQVAEPPAPDGKRHWQVMFSARALRAAAEPYGVTDLANWLLTAQGIFYRGQLIPIRSVIQPILSPTASTCTSLIATE